MAAPDAVSPNDAASPSDARPLDGITVIELAQWVAGPAAAGLLADWGADVIKVEAPSGDPQRNMFAAVGIDKPLPNPAFAQDNRGKRSAALDLRTDGDRAVLESLLAEADLFVTNLRIDALERLDLDPTSLSARHPQLIIGSLTGYGAIGPAREVPGYDIGAFVSRTGLARTNAPKGGPPLNIRSGVGDHVTGMTLAAGLLAALHQRNVTGTGSVVETSLFQAGTYAGSWDLSTQATFGKLASMRPRERHEAPMVNSYRAADDRWFYLIGLEAARHFPMLCAAIDRPDLAEDERFARASGLREHAEALIAELDATFATRPLDEWAAAFDANDVWWAPCQSMAEVVADPQAEALGLIVDTDTSDGITTPDGRHVRTVAAPVRFDGQAFSPRRPVPSLGEHTDEVRANGFGDQSASGS